MSAQVSDDSLDSLVEYPAQLSVIGPPAAELFIVKAITKNR